MTKKTFPIIGMHCASCKNLIERQVGKLEGVSSVNVNYATEKMIVEFDEQKVSHQNLIDAVKSAGTYQMITDSHGEEVLASPGEIQKMKQQSTSHHDAHGNGKAHDHAAVLKEKEYSALKRKVITVAILVTPFVLLMIAMLLRILGVLSFNHELLGYISFDALRYKINTFFFLQFILATPILFWGGSQFFKSAWAALKIKAANMDTLVVLGSLTAWIFSTVVTFFPNVFPENQSDVFFEAATFITFFILLGRLLEARAKGSAAEAIKRLGELQAKEARVIRNGNEVLLPIDQVIVGDEIIVKPGEKVPVDGKIIEGSSAIDESMVTGESIPTDKKTGDTVIGSTINKSSTFTFKAEKVGADTMLANITKLVEEAQGTTAPIQKLADKISSVFVPVVITLSILGFLFWYFAAPQLGLISENTELFQFAIYITTTMLIIACPCALGLATPTAVMVGSGKAAEKGILIKDAEALETAHKISTLVFDKTGTLTKGKPETTDFLVMDNIENSGLFKEELKATSKEDYQNFILKIALSIEEKSEHPLATAVVKFATQKNIEKISIQNFKNHEGTGVFAEFGNHKVFIGNDKIIEENNVMKYAELENDKLRLKNEGKTVVSFAIDQKEIAIFAIADTIKEDAKQSIEKLHQLGIKTIMLTGDNHKTAEAIATKLNIDDIKAEVLPHDKAQIIKELKQNRKENEIIAMVGDGINDAPALAEADIGIAMGTGTDIAIESGDVILVEGTLQKLIDAISVSKETLKIIKQNLGWAFGYNIIAIPVAAGILYPFFGVLLSPIIASAAMAFSSFSVVLNSLRVKRR